MKNYNFSVTRHDVSMMLSGAMLLTAIKSPNVKTRIFFGVVGVASFLGDAIKVSPVVEERWKKNADKFMNEHFYKVAERKPEDETEPGKEPFDTI